MAVVKVCYDNCRKCKFCSIDQVTLTSFPGKNGAVRDFLWCEYRDKYVDRSWGKCNKYRTA